MVFIYVIQLTQIAPYTERDHNRDVTFVYIYTHKLTYGTSSSSGWGLYSVNASMYNPDVSVDERLLSPACAWWSREVYLEKGRGIFTQIWGDWILCGALPSYWKKNWSQGRLLTSLLDKTASHLFLNDSSSSTRKSCFTVTAFAWVRRHIPHVFPDDVTLNCHTLIVLKHNQMRLLALVRRVSTNHQTPKPSKSSSRANP